MLHRVEPIPLLPSEGLLDPGSALLPAPPRLGLATSPPITLEDVLASAERTYPPFLEMLRRRPIAAGNLLSAFGVFDLDVNADARNWALGYYQRYLYDLFFEQYTPFWGTTFFAGYRVGLGNWPIYYQYLDTLDAGAYVAGFEMPLLRNRDIDARRARVWQAEIERLQVEPQISRRRIDLIRDASAAYWAWVAAGQRVIVYERLLRIAEQRNRALQRQVELGLVPPVELTENQRQIVQRQSLLIDSRQDYQREALSLSLYLRDRHCLPQIPPADRLPPDFPVPMGPDPLRLPEDLEAALRLRPELRELRLEAQRVGIDLQLARNQLLPELNLYLYAEQNTGPPGRLGPGSNLARVVSEQIERNKGPFIFESSLLFEVPLQRRESRGRVRVADAQLQQVALQQRFAADQIVVDVKGTVATLQAIYGLVLRNQQEVELNRRLELAELRRFDLGLSNLLVVNIRELATADAQVEAIGSLSRFYVALADYRAALGLDAIPAVPAPSR